MAGQEPIHIPAYAMNRVFSIGSGDIFSAAFTYFWALKDLPAHEAADLASRSAAFYCHSQSTARLEPNVLREIVNVPIKLSERHTKVYLAGPFFNLPQRWLVEEARNHLLDQGLDVFSPLHDVGLGGDPMGIAKKDLDALEASDCVLALLDGADPGTVFEVGYAISKKIPVIAFAQQLAGESLTMMTGTGCEIVLDFTTAIYRTAWTGRTG
jgi:nucleoside 2-deoxyribosyltransferase